MTQTLNFSRIADPDVGLLEVQEFVRIDVSSDGRRTFARFGGATNTGHAIIFQSVYKNRLASPASPCGGTCSFTQSFIAPAYRCVDVGIQDPGSPWCRGGPDESGTCARDQGVDSTLYVAGNGTYDGNFAGETDWTLWVLHRYVYPQYGEQLVQEFTDEMYENFTFKCQFWEARYDVRRSWDDFEPQVQTNLT
jgi:hypothetical protein